MQPTIVPVSADHFSFILSSFTRSRAHHYQHLYADYGAYCEASKAQLLWLLKNAYCLVACDPEMPTSYFGYIIWQPADDAPEKAQNKPVVYYCYIKYPFRRLGLATLLVCTALGQSHRPIKASIMAATTSTQFQKHIEPKGEYVFVDGLIGSK